MSEADRQIPSTDDETVVDLGIPRPFATGYDRRSGEMLVYGGFALGVFFFIGAISVGRPGIFGISLACIAVALYHLPILQKGRAQLGADEQGLMIDGIGIIRWDAVREVKIMERAVRNIRNAELVIELEGPLESSLSVAEPAGFFRSMLIQPWKLLGERTIIVKLEPLRGKPEEILERIQRYLTPPA